VRRKSTLHVAKRIYLFFIYWLSYLCTIDLHLSEKNQLVGRQTGEKKDKIIDRFEKIRF